MPIISKSTLSNPLSPEGHYAGICRKVSYSYNQDGVGMMRIPLHDPSGKLIATAVLADTDQRRWTFTNLIRSTELQVPDNGDNYIIDPSDVEGLVAYFEVSHFRLQTGRVIASVKFHSKTWTLKCNPELANLEFPGARTPGVLRATTVNPDQENTSSAASTTPETPNSSTLPPSPPTPSSSTPPPSPVPTIPPASAVPGTSTPVNSVPPPTVAAPPTVASPPSPAAASETPLNPQPTANPLAGLSEAEILAVLAQLRSSNNKNSATGK